MDAKICQMAKNHLYLLIRLSDDCVINKKRNDSFTQGILNQEMTKIIKELKGYRKKMTDANVFLTDAKYKQKIEILFICCSTTGFARFQF